MTLPIVSLVMPSCLKGQTNGKLPEALLVPCGISSFRMVAPAARAMNAMVAAMEEAGFEVRATGTYRTYEQQENLFVSRYSKTSLSGRPTKSWKGVTYWQKPNTAVAATPGTSNHGLGLAIDFAEERNGKPGVESLSTGMVNWLIKNAARFGYSAELQSEPWHWRFIAGDRELPAVESYYAQAVSESSKVPTSLPVNLGDIDAALSAARTKVLRKGSRSDAVKWAQIGLNKHGADLPVTGYFGAQTHAAVVAFQESQKLKADGVIGPKTWAALFG